MMRQHTVVTVAGVDAGGDVRGRRKCAAVI